MEACRRCGSRHPERELVSLWAGRHYWPRPEDEWVRWHEQHAIRLCHPCAGEVWPALRDAVGLCSPAVAHPAAALAALRLACGDLRGPGVPCDDLMADYLREAEGGPPSTSQDDHHFPVGAEQGAPRLRPGEER